MKTEQDYPSWQKGAISGALQVENLRVFQMNPCLGAWVFLFLAIFCLGIPGTADGREVIVESPQVALDYGRHSRGEVFTDTLTFFRVENGRRTGITPLDIEPTCDCITGNAVPEPSGRFPSGYIAFTYQVFAEEPDGVGTKVVYVFTADPSYDLVRLVLRVDVFPGTGDIGRLQQPAEHFAQKPVPLSEDRGSSLSAVKGGGEGTDTANLVASGENLPATDKKLKVLFFYSSTCMTCLRIKRQTVPEVNLKWSDSVELEEIDTHEKEGFSHLLEMRSAYGGARSSSPFVFYVGHSVIGDGPDLAGRLNAAIEKALENEEITHTVSEVRGPLHLARQTFRSMRFWTVVGAGLLDGINPCAFATLVFFISLLNYSGSNRRQMITVGAGFTTSVFVVYLLLGLGAFRVLERLSIYTAVSKVIYGATIVLLLVLIVLTAADVYRFYRTGQTRDQLLQLSPRTKRRIHDVIRRGLKTRNLLIGSIGIGALVTLFEAACTGQVYLPTIVLVLQDPTLRPNALFFLVLYNLLFIIPLVVVFLLAYGGIASGSFAAWSRRNYVGTRIALGLLFLLLAILMATELVR